jgi:hypothetical protein
VWRRGGPGAHGGEVARGHAAGVWGALRAAHGVHAVECVWLNTAGALMHGACWAGAGGRRAFSVVGAFAAQRLVGGCGRWGGTAVAVVDVVFHMFVELFEKEGALEAHLLDAPVKAQDALAGRVVGLFDVVDAPAEVDAFTVVRSFDRGREVFLRVRACCYKMC